MTMVEKIAREIEPLSWAALGAGDTLTHKERRTSSLRKAKRILGGPLMEPTEAMRKAGFHANVFDNRGGCPGVPSGAECDDWNDPDKINAFLAQTGICRVARITKPADDAWRAMITKALSEAEEGK